MRIERIIWETKLKRFICAVFEHRLEPMETIDMGVFGSIVRRQCVRCGDVFTYDENRGLENISAMRRLILRHLEHGMRESIKAVNDAE